MAADIEGMLEKVKLRIGVDGEENDPVLRLMLQDAVMAVTLYCNRETFPWQLEYIVKQMVVNVYERDNEGNVASVKRGDTQINYAQTITQDDMTLQQRDICSKFRHFRVG